MKLRHLPEDPAIPSGLEGYLHHPRSVPADGLGLWGDLCWLGAGGSGGSGDVEVMGFSGGKLVGGDWNMTFIFT